MKKLMIMAVMLSMTLFAGDLVVKQSGNDVQTTMDKLEKIVKSKGAVVFARIDHRAGAKKAGMDMNDEQLLIFGKPRAGTRIMLNDPKAGLDLPMKILVYKDFEGKTWIVYRDPMALKKEYKLESCAVLPQLSKAMNAITDAASK